MKVSSAVKTVGGIVGVLGAAATAYALAARPRMLRWGAKPEERDRVYPGDEFVLNPQIRATHAITVHAPPENVFPWLLQLGSRRAGFYSNAAVEHRLFGFDAQNADRILPEFQALKVGDAVPFGDGIAPRVALLATNRHLVLRGTARGDGEANAAWIRPGENLNMTWGFFLEPLENGDTRLIERMRIEYTTTLANNALYYGFVEPGAFFMERAMLRGIKARAEGVFGHALAERPSWLEAIEDRVRKTRLATVWERARQRVSGAPEAGPQNGVPVTDESPAPMTP